jgi:hypothetical protein
MFVAAQAVYGVAATQAADDVVARSARYLIAARGACEVRIRLAVRRGALRDRLPIGRDVVCGGGVERSASAAV